MPFAPHVCVSQVGFPSSFKVTAEWSLTSNWLATALIKSPSTVKPVINVPAADFWDGVDDLKEIMKQMEVEEQGPRNSPPSTPRPARTPCASPSNGSSSDSPIMLSNAQIAAALTKLQAKRDTLEA